MSDYTFCFELLFINSSNRNPITTMSILYSIPENVSGDILSNWCQPSDIHIVDSATCNVLERNVFLALLKSHFFTLKNCQNDSRLLHYTCLRKINLEALSLDNVCTLVDNYVSSDKIQTLNIFIDPFYDFVRDGEPQDYYKTLNTAVLNFVNRCPVLTSLAISNSSACFSDDFYCCVDNSIYEKLSVFNITSTNGNLTKRTIEKISLNCSSLREFKLVTNFDNIADVETVVCQLVKKNPQLIALRLLDSRHDDSFWSVSDGEVLFTGTLLTYIAEYCSNITYVAFTTYDLLDVNAVLSFIRTHSQLKLISILSPFVDSFRYDLDDKRLHISLFEDRDGFVEYAPDHEFCVPLVESIRDLTSVVFENYDQIPDELVSIVARSNPELTHFESHFGGDMCAVVTKQAYCELLTQCPLITSITLYTNGWNESDYMEIIVLTSASLHTLAIYMDDDITTEIVMEILSLRPCLKNLYIDDSGDIDYDLDKHRIVECIKLRDGTCNLKPVEITTF